MHNLRDYIYTYKTKTRNIRVYVCKICGVLEDDTFKYRNPQFLNIVNHLKHKHKIKST